MGNSWGWGKVAGRYVLYFSFLSLCQSGYFSQVMSVYVGGTGRGARQFLVNSKTFSFSPLKRPNTVEMTPTMSRNIFEVIGKLRNLKFLSHSWVSFNGFMIGYLLTSGVDENRFQLKLIYIICNLTLKLFGKLFACGKMSTFR